jgi:cytosine/adenosine deaminase-related metal-dependent hydrolase
MSEKAQETRTYTARWIFPVETPPLPGGTITIAGAYIHAVEPHGTRSADVDLGNAAIVPGLVNAHTHLDLTGLRGRCAPTPDFTHWLRQVIALRRTRTPTETQADIANGLDECLRTGTTLIGDIAYEGASLSLLEKAPCRSVVFRELLGLTEERARQSWLDAVQWLRDHPGNDRAVAGLSPHAPYSVRSSLYEIAGRRAIPIATHLAESPAELELLHDRQGSFVDFLRELNVWDPSGPCRDPLDVVRALPSGIFVHGNYLDPHTPLTPRQSVVFCPRTHAAFGHRRHPFPAMLEQGVRVALGTDSLASNPDLDVRAEARFLHEHYPEVAASTILRMLTLNGAAALGVGNVTGSLMPGKSADLVVLALSGGERGDPYELILDVEATINDVMWRGHWRNEAVFV